jgi:hypothetical protein
MGAHAGTLSETHQIKLLTGIIVAMKKEAASFF